MGLGASGKEDVKKLHEATSQVAAAMLEADSAKLGNRGPRRYSFGGASPSMHAMHSRPWPLLLESIASGPVAKLLARIFPGGYLAAGGGGDFVLGHTDTYQTLHRDVGDVSSDAFHTLERPPAVSVSFILADLPCSQGPVRIV